MIEKMKLLHIAGPKGDIDRVVKVYLNKYDIHFENAMTSLGNLKNIRPFVETNLYNVLPVSGTRHNQLCDVADCAGHGFDARRADSRHEEVPRGERQAGIRGDDE